MYEPDLSIFYFKNNYKAAITLNRNGFVRHIGYADHVRLPHEKF
jgi:hypothetical protein